LFLIILILAVGQLFHQTVTRLRQAEYEAWKQSLLNQFRGPFTTKPTASYDEIMALRQAIAEETATVVHYHTLPPQEREGSFWDLITWIGDL